ncbi:zf-HC2 domain-containing protein [candidate division KSB1 bacterium]|nr:zf-HC2 domain-containing protein [candidate division KSB1 bacterium]
MKCIDPEMKKLVSLYQFNMLDDERKIKVEAHLLECEACFEELYRLSPVLEAIEEMPERFLDALQPKETLNTRIVKFLKKEVESVKRIIISIFSPFARLAKKPAFKIVVPAIAIILLAVVFLFPPSEQYSDIAILEKAPYLTLRSNGHIKLTLAQKLFYEAMTFYEQDNYNQAILKLSGFIAREPDNAYGHFFLSVSLLLTDDIENGVRHLHKATELCQKQDNMLLLEKCYWYLGNAYLKTNDVDDALKLLRLTVELRGDFEAKALKQIAKIDRIKKKESQN